MNRRDFLLLPLSLAGCISLPSAPANSVPKFGRFTSVPASGRVTLEVHLHDTETAARAACNALNQRGYPGAAPRPPACTSATFTPGVEHVHVARPSNWDDHDPILQLGHEVLHALGGEHR